ncbi:acetyl-CoA carboxylase biotin carboxyl carrier protein subunit [Enterococcus asini]|uniref:acetyl-CoA carboxylase biotin carboxyl carrier protein subunit n=1 Tax=Enterococcus asini TaxID=57732 RepID=UPI00288D879C|nr:acetyl-CoA carboxylase biotin carboxyl carrier protein subunit [Enterococcus asini]MDT2757302.1 acetyl-CoA carboxylase biotin carboxyl carrier protein subunit [Enterococcus asini]
MLRKFKIAIDGKEYLVEMEELTEGLAAPVAPPAQQVVQPVAHPTPESAPAPVTPEPKPAPKANATAGEGIDAPMPGTILKVLANVGDQVTANQPILILEAMKMENEIVAPKDGVVTAIHVTAGEMVNPGQPLITID